MSLNGKRDHFELADLVAFGAFCGIKAPKARGIIEAVHAPVGKWMEFADEAGVPERMATAIQRGLRLGIAA